MKSKTATTTDESSVLLASSSGGAGAPTPQQAFYSGDLEASKGAHDQARNGCAHGEEAHQKGGDYLKALIFGGLDGILTSVSSELSSEAKRICKHTPSSDVMCS
jgi:hypothetical protein